MKDLATTDVTSMQVSWQIVASKPCRKPASVAQWANTLSRSAVGLAG